MLDYLKEIKSEEYDGIFFIPSEDEEMIHIEGCKYKEPGEDFKGEMGNIYHILLFKQDADGNVCNQDLFEAVLVEPLEYISQLIPQNWYGLICKKTTTSQEFVEETFDKLSEV